MESMCSLYTSPSKYSFLIKLNIAVFMKTRVQAKSCKLFLRTAKGRILILKKDHTLLKTTYPRYARPLSNDSVCLKELKPIFPASQGGSQLPD